MKGISLQYYAERQHMAGWTDMGWQLSYGESPFQYPKDKAESTMSQIETATRSKELHGFTLFFHDGRGWQMSVRRKNENGWDVKIISEEKAQAILSMLKASGHPDGPIDVVDPATVARAVEINDIARQGLTAAVAAFSIAAIVSGVEEPPL